MGGLLVIKVMTIMFTKSSFQKRLWICWSIFDEIDNKRNKRNDYKPRIPNKINTKNAPLNYLRVIEDRNEN